MTELNLTELNLNQLTANIVSWAHGRNLIEGSNYRAQCVKLGEELGEAFEALDKDDEEEFQDAVGDMYVVATIMCAQLGGSITLARENASELVGSMEAAFGRVCGFTARGKEPQLLAALGEFVNRMEEQMNVAPDIDFTLTEAVTGAWNTIKDRKGRMVDGVFIKEGEA